MAEIRDALSAQIALNRQRQCELYGAPLGDRVRRLTGALGVSQARLARSLGLSPAMLSQLVSARRVKIGDPAVLARMLLLDKRIKAAGKLTKPAVVDELLAEVAGAQWNWTGSRRSEHAAADALRDVADPRRLAAAAAALGSSFPELAEVLRQAAGL